MILCMVFALGQVFGQEMVHWLINKDSITDCSFMRSGIFVNQIHECSYTKDYYITIEDSIKTEYIGRDGYYIRSKIEYVSDCMHKSTIIDMNNPSSPLKVGDVFYMEVLGTALVDDLVKIRVTLEDTLDYKAIIVVLQKVRKEDLERIIY